MVISLLILSVLVTITASISYPVRILPVGDSITQGIASLHKQRGKHPINGSSTYRRALYKSFGCSITFVGPWTSGFMGVQPCQDFPQRHAAKWGVLAKDMPKLLQSYLQHPPEDLSPDVILVLIGTNDLAMHYSPGTVLRSRAIRKTLKAVSALVHALSSAFPQAQMFVSYLLPTSKEYGEAIADFNAAMSMDKICQPPTIARCVGPPPGMGAHEHFYDGLHPNPRGEEMIAEMWGQVLKLQVGVTHCESTLPPGSPTSPSPLGPNPLPTALANTSSTLAFSTAASSTLANISATSIVSILASPLGPSPVGQSNEGSSQTTSGAGEERIMKVSGSTWWGLLFLLTCGVCCTLYVVKSKQPQMPL